MARLSIKRRVMLWYAFAMSLVLVVTSFVLVSTADRAVKDEVRENLTLATDRTVNDVRVVKGVLSLDHDIVYYMDGAYVVISRDDGVVISGLVPEGFPTGVAFVAYEIREVTSDGGGRFYVYDRVIENDSLGRIWVRGMSSADIDDVSPAMALLTRIMLVVLPLMLAFALVGGWLITRQAFAPLAVMNQTVAQIQDGGDLSRRIPVEDPAGRDEIEQTAISFNSMLGRIEESFATERRFTSDASHELRTPTAVILAQAEYALDNLDETSEVSESLQVIAGQAKKMSSLISQLLTMTRVDRGLQTLTRERVDASLAAEEALAAHTRLAAERGIELVADVPMETYCWADPALFSRLLDNLVSNAIKYGYEGGHVWLDVAPLAGEGEHVRLRVTDDGRGIPAKDREHIWERFWRGPDTLQDDQSMGIGLAMAKTIVELHEGRIWVESCTDGSLGFSTRFTVEL